MRRASRTSAHRASRPTLQKGPRGTATQPSKARLVWPLQGCSQIQPKLWLSYSPPAERSGHLNLNPWRGWPEALCRATDTPTAPKPQAEAKAGSYSLTPSGLHGASRPQVPGQAWKGTSSGSMSPQSCACDRTATQGTEGRECGRWDAGTAVPERLAVCTDNRGGTWDRSALC